MKDPLIETKPVLDLSEFETKTKSGIGVDCAIIDPRTGEETATVFTMLGMDSDEYLTFKDAEEKEAQVQLMDAMVKSSGASQNKKAAEKKELKSEEEKLIEKIIVLTKGWKNVMWEGVIVDFTPEMARTIYTKNAIVRNQLRRFIEDRRNFFQVAQPN